ncbi:hypothetical protein HDV05_007852 [Chytridiales sp. JEL 0842]|nr:hypothetical protein HDV05_007852 [Chytridiales sp. JEL 0842]
MTTGYTASYVSQLVANEASRTAMLRQLEKGLAFTESCDAVVAMIDISGYSSLTSNLTLLGKISSELITSTVGSYLNKLISFITEFHGDIIKFLGDAILVCFRVQEGETQQDTALRATACCLQIMIDYSQITIDLSQALNGNQGRSGSGTQIEEQKELTVHVAAIAGTIQNVIIGNAEERLDYCIYGECLGKLGEILDNTKGQQLGIADNVLRFIPDDIIPEINSWASKRSDEELPFTVFNTRDCPHVMLILSEVASKYPKLMEALEKCGQITKEIAADTAYSSKRRASVSGHMQCSLLLPAPKDGDEILKLFVNQSYLKKAMQGRESRNTVSARRDTMAFASDITSEFRKVSIIFVKIYADFTPERAQLAMVNFIKILKNLEGDIVNIAARALSVKTNSDAVRCDAATYQETKEDFNFTSLGLFAMKGKKDPVELWAATSKFQHRLSIQSDQLLVTPSAANQVQYFGYGAERDRIQTALEEWVTNEQQTNVVIEGPSGMGKSKLLDFVMQISFDANMTCCLTQGTEMKKFSPYFAIQNLMTFVVKKLMSLPELTSLTLVSHTSLAASSMFGRDRRKSNFSFDHTSDGEGSRRTSMRILGPSSIGSGDDMRAHQAITVQKILEMVGENPMLAPLVAEVIPFLSIPDNAFTKSMDGATRGTYLKNLIVRLVNKSFELCGRYVIMFDDAQWLDSMSLDIIRDIVKRCPQSFICFFTRPIADIKEDSTLAKLVQDESKTIHIILNGLSLADVKAIVRYKFGEYLKDTFQAVDPDVVKAFHEKSQGVPLVLDTIIESVKMKFNEILAISDSGVITLKDLNSIAMISNVSTLSTATMLQYDRLSTEFQAVLRKASILGQYFTLFDLAYLLASDIPNITPQNLENIIKENDAYNYLIKQVDHNETPSAPSKPAGTTDPSQSVAAEEEDQFKMYPYFFRHIQICATLYDCQSFSERAFAHEQAAEYFEMNLDETNREQLLPIIVYHYKRTARFVKQLVYYEELAFSHFRRCHFREAVVTFEPLLEVFEQIQKANEEKLQKVDAFKPENNSVDEDEEETIEIEDYRQANWLAYYGASLLETKNFKPLKDILVRCLKLCQHTWPNDPKEAKKMTIKTMIQFEILWRKTKGGVREPLSLPSRIWKRVTGPKTSAVSPAETEDDASDSNPAVKKYKTITESLFISYVTLFRGGILAHIIKDEMGLVLFRLCNVLMQCSYKSRKYLCEWISAAYLASFASSWSLPGVSQRLFLKARKLEAGLPVDERGESPVYQLHHFAGMKFFQLGLPSEGEKCYETHRKYYELRGDVQKIMLNFAFSLTTFLALGKVHHRVRPAIETAMAEQGIYRPSTFGGAVGCLFYTSFDHEEMSKLALLLEIDTRALPPQPVVFAAQHRSFCSANISKGDFASALDRFSKMAESCGHAYTFFTSTTDALFESGLLAWRLAEPSFVFQATPPGLELGRVSKMEINVTTWTPEDKQKLLEGAEKCRERARFFAIKNKMHVFYWPMVLLEAVIMYVSGQRKKSMDHLLRSLKRKKRMKLLEEMPMVKAWIWTVLGLFGDAKVRPQYYKEAMRLYESFEAIPVIRWLEECEVRRQYVKHLM